jgi:ribosomal protein S24E
MAAQSRSRVGRKVRIHKAHDPAPATGQITGPEAFEIILINSHDGTSSYQMIAGMFRFVCCNGMMLGDTIQDIRVPHRGSITDNVIEVAYTIVEDFGEAAEEMEVMKSLQLSTGEQEVYAQAALALKYEDHVRLNRNSYCRPEARGSKGHDLEHL